MFFQVQLHCTIFHAVYNVHFGECSWLFCASQHLSTLFTHLYTYLYTYIWLNFKRWTQKIDTLCAVNRLYTAEKAISDTQESMGVLRRTDADVH